MNPFLLCMFGPLKDRKLELSNEPIVLGRERSNDVYISDLLLSRRHCSIEKTNYDFVIRDLQSRNGVFVNGVPVRERTLNHGDRIEIGTSTFLFLTHDEQPNFPESPVLDDSLQAESTLSLKAEDSQYLKDTPSSNSGRVYIRIGEVFKAGNDLSTFSKRLLETISDLIPYERAVLLEAESLKTIASNIIKGSALRQFSKSLCEKAISQKVGTLASKFTLPESISSSMVESVLCVPFVWLNRVLCLLYMDTFNASKKFEEDHLQITSAVSSLSAPVFYHLQETDRLQQQNRELQQRLLGNKTIIGESAEIRKVLELISRIGRASTTVLITGESGTGKELAARAIHAASSTPGSPFVAINCAAIPESLLESELFGYEKGAFTGAVSQKKGRIELANGGTLFLDEIGELDPLLQAKLLRVLQEHEFERVGGTNPIKVDIRVIAATNRSLEKSIEEGKFRSDLYYRLNVIRLNMPSLRELGDDILLLAQYFISTYTAKMGRRVHGLSADTKECLLKYDWPGNVRELQNAIERAVALGTSEWIELDDLPEPLLEKRPIPSNPGTLSFQDALLQLKRDLILKAFEGTKGNFTEAASRLGVNPNHLYRLVKNLNLKDQI